MNVMGLDSVRVATSSPSSASRTGIEIDLTLIRWMLSLSPLERLEILQASTGLLERLREGARTEP